MLHETEIYNENVFDLMTTGPALRVRERLDSDKQTGTHLCQVHALNQTSLELIMGVYGCVIISQMFLWKTCRNKKLTMPPLLCD